MTWGVASPPHWESRVALYSRPTAEYDYVR